ncbi:branched-chain amino acid ABC transporter permease [Curvibacter sp. RS43]|uniref:Branched-chain amino acid ABC transporter permease n=1 Tax=Curvibacter microcysteis TaxID=3026419 RepID=A0ABT5ME13_9BURK|nr:MULTISPECIES: branched-chain amino acid ABC transporter permease [unclassified Curvibacter]MDD0810155.1 branched-chain amino acid ABC transporter permease [Curvibacter sp. RS43]MDD0814656.1 branched-chain amino acid ABC transporter permease [Curvibacter sp. HBC28]
MKSERWLACLLCALLALFPLLAPALGLDFYVSFVRRAMIVALAAASLNFILGFGGMAALGHAGFVGVGAYALVALYDAGFESAWLLWPAAMLVAGAVAALIGLIALRTRGVYLIMSTLAFAQMLYYVAVSLRAYGGDDGYNLAARPQLGLGLDSTDEATFYWVVLALLALVMLGLNRATHSRFGHALMGLRDNETRMRAMGYPVFKLMLAAFALSGAIAGLSGALLVSHNAFVSPSVMHWTQSATLIVMVVIGGVGLRWGGPVGAMVWIGLEEGAKQLTEFWHLPLGLLLILIVFVAPRGLASVVAHWRAPTPSKAAQASPGEIA